MRIVLHVVEEMPREYVEENAQRYLDLQTGIVIAIIVSAIIALIPLAFAIWGIVQRSPVFTILALIVVGVVVAFGIAVITNLDRQLAGVQVSRTQLEGRVTAVVERTTRVSTVRLDSQSRSLLVNGTVNELKVDEDVQLDCATIDGAIALYTPCELVDAE